MSTAVVLILLLATGARLEVPVPEGVQCEALAADLNHVVATGGRAVLPDGQRILQASCGVKA